MPESVKHLPSLPVERALKVISGRWKAVILYHLYGEPRRLSDLARLIPDVSQKVLIEQLREMEAHGLLVRAPTPNASQRVEYKVTALGFSLKPVLLALCEWGRRHAGALGETARLTACSAVSLTADTLADDDALQQSVRCNRGGEFVDAVRDVCLSDVAAPGGQLGARDARDVGHGSVPSANEPRSIAGS